MRFDEETIKNNFFRSAWVKAAGVKNIRRVEDNIFPNIVGLIHNTAYDAQEAGYPVPVRGIFVSDNDKFIMGHALSNGHYLLSRATETALSSGTVKPDVIKVFIAHEMGHVRHGHKTYSEANEGTADEFAAKIYGRDIALKGMETLLKQPELANSASHKERYLASVEKRLDDLRKGKYSDRIR